MWAPALFVGGSLLAALLLALRASARAARTQVQVACDCQPDPRVFVAPEVVRDAIYAAQAADPRVQVVPPALALAVVEHESDFRPKVVSHAGAYGIMQVLIPTALGVAPHLVHPDGCECAQLFDVRTNVGAGLAVLADNYQRWGNWTDAVSAYNSGRPIATAPATTRQDYVPAVLGAWPRWQAWLDDNP